MPTEMRHLILLHSRYCRALRFDDLRVGLGLEELDLVPVISREVAHTAFVFSGLFSVASQGGAQVRVRTGVKKSDIRAAKRQSVSPPMATAKTDMCAAISAVHKPLLPET